MASPAVQEDMMIVEGVMSLYDSGDQVKFRKRRWAKYSEFYVVCQTIVVGLPNFWRFPFFCYRYGVTVFAGLYIIMVVIVGRPMFYLDLAMGQFSGRGSVHMYNALGQAWIGLGVMQTICVIYVTSYYAYVLSVGMFYCLQSFTSKLPWEYCRPEWGPTCVNGYEKHLVNMTGNLTSSVDFFLRVYVQRQWDVSIYGIGYPDWRLLLCLFFTWELVFLNSMVGIKTAAKAAYFMAIFPITVLVVLTVRSLVLPGAAKGIIRYFIPNLKPLKSITIYVDAISQVYFSLGIGYNLCGNAGSYNKINEKINKTSFLMSFMDIMVSLLATVAFLACCESDREAGLVRVSSTEYNVGMTMIFITYADIIANTKYAPQVVAVVFYIMFYTLGMGIILAFGHVLLTNLMELVPKFKEWHAAAILSSVGFFAGVIYTTPAGQTILNMIDEYGNVYVLSMTALLQIIAICFSRGLLYWCWDLEFMTGETTSYYWRWIWGIILPPIMIFNLITVFAFDRVNISRTMRSVGVSLSFVAFAPFPIGIVMAIYMNRKKGFKGAIKAAYSTNRWLPFRQQDIDDYKIFRAKKLETYKNLEISIIKNYFYAFYRK